MQKSKERGKKVGHVFRDKLLPVDTCRSVFSSTAGVILTFDQAAFFFGKKRKAEKELLIAG